MNKEQKVNWIKYWLQRFGNRDKSTFNVSVDLGEITWEISMQYNYSFSGRELNPFDWCSYHFKHTFNNGISDRTDEELDQIISKLKTMQNY